MLSDAALDDLCRKQPSNLRELLAVTGIGERKAELYGSEIFAAFEHSARRPRRRSQVPRESPAEETMRLVREGKSFEEIASIRGRQVTSRQHGGRSGREGPSRLPHGVGGRDAHRQIEEAVSRLGSQWLKPLREALPAEITYEQIRLVVAYVRRESAR